MSIAGDIIRRIAEADFDPADMRTLRNLISQQKLQANKPVFQAGGMDVASDICRMAGCGQSSIRWVERSIARLTADPANSLEDVARKLLEQIQQHIAKSWGEDEPMERTEKQTSNAVRNICDVLRHHGIKTAADDDQ